MARLSGLDHLRGFGIILVLVFSLWGWMYSSPKGFEPLVHIVKGEFHIGDMVFPLFLFLSGVSVWLYSSKLASEKKSALNGIEKFLTLLLFSLIISASRLFQTFPDEVTTIAASGLLVFLLHRGFGEKSLLLYIALVLSSLLLVPQALAEFAPPAYFSLLTAMGFLSAQKLFPKGNLDYSKFTATSLKLSVSFLALAVLLTLLYPLDRLSLSPSFLFLCCAASITLLSLFTWLFDLRGFRIDFLSALGRRSLAGWALLYFVSSLIWLLGLKDAYLPEAYYPFCALLLVLLYLGLKWMEKRKKN